VDFVLEKTGVPDLTKDELTKAKDRLKGFAASDKARLQREEALNQLEGFTYKIRDLLEGEAFTAASTEAERTKLAQKSGVTSEWLYDDGADATKDEFKAKLKELQDLVAPIQARINEAEGRPGLVTGLKESLEQTQTFLGTMHKQIDEYEEWQASAAASAAASEATPAEAASETPVADFDGLEDADATERTKEDAAEEKGPDAPLYKRADLDELEAVRKSTAEWLEDVVARQEALSATDDAVLLIKDLNTKREKLEKAGRDLALKGVNNFDGKKKKGSKSSGDKKSKTGSGSKPAFTMNAEDGGKVFTEEDIEELLAKLKQDQERKDAEDKTTHDEL